MALVLTLFSATTLFYSWCLSAFLSVELFQSIAFEYFALMEISISLLIFNFMKIPLSGIHRNADKSRMCNDGKCVIMLDALTTTKPLVTVTQNQKN